MTRKAKTKAAEIMKVSANFPKDLWKQLRHCALEDDETVTDILVRLAGAYIAKKKSGIERALK